MRHNSKLKKLNGGKKVEIPQKESRPGEWKTKLLPAPVTKDGELFKSRTISPIIEEALIQDIADGMTPDEIEAKYDVARRHIYTILLRRFGSKSKMKEVLTSQCYENAMAFQEHARQNIQSMSGAQAVLAAKLSIDSGLNLEKGTAKEEVEIDFGSLVSLGDSLQRIEKKIDAKVIS